MLGADACGDIGIEVTPRKHRAMPVDMPPLEQAQLGHRFGVAVDHAGVIHEFRQTDT